MALQTPLTQTNNRSYKTYSARLAKLGINTIEDFLYHLPFRYEDYSIISKIDHVQAGEIVTIQGKVLSAKNQYLKSARIRTIQKAIVFDDTGSIELTWFNQPFIIKSFIKDFTVSVSGRVVGAGKKLSMQSPEFEILYNDSSTPIHTARLTPVYPETKGVSSKWLRRQIHKILLDYENEIKEYLPHEIIDKFHFTPLPTAIKQIHYPRNLEETRTARNRLSFDELFLIQLASIKKRTLWKKNNKGIPLAVNSNQQELDKFTASLPFTLTTAQQKSAREILHDLGQTKQMNRLLQGDVGSGKTVVAAIAMHLVYLNGYQSILLAPTEILAKQHFATIKKLLVPFGIKVGLVTGSTNSIKNKVLSIKESKKGGGKKTLSPIPYNLSPNILVGTHALFNEKIKLEKLALVVIDEQQRFGVEQRSLIRKKGERTHLLTMTATPIPRTVALTMYGELDLSYLNEMPVGRKKIKTWLVPAEKREAGYKWIEKQIKDTDSQVFIICPFIEESENMQTVKAAAKEFERLKTEVFPPPQTWSFAW